MIKMSHICSFVRLQWRKWCGGRLDECSLGVKLYKDSLPDSLLLLIATRGGSEACCSDLDDASSISLFLLMMQVLPLYLC
jgi:hypothetical protein